MTIDLAPQLNANYWDCECQVSDYSYIKPAEQDECKDCGAIKDEAPDSHACEVRASMIAQSVSLPVNIHDDAITAWVVCVDSLTITPAPEPTDVENAEEWHWYKLNDGPTVSMVRADVDDFMEDV